MVAAATDPFSGQPESKATPARVAPIEYAYRGFALTRRSIVLSEGTWFARLAVAGGEGLLFATNQPPPVWRDFMRRLMPEDAELTAYSDQSHGVARFGPFRSGRFDGCLFVGPRTLGAAMGHDALGCLSPAPAAERDRRILLSGRGGDGWLKPGLWSVPVSASGYRPFATPLRKAAP